jgi:hypothetical protein
MGPGSGNRVRAESLTAFAPKRDLFRLEIAFNQKFRANFGAKLLSST